LTAEQLVGKPAHELLHHTRADEGRHPRAECPIHGPAGAELAVEAGTDDLFWRRDGTSFPGFGLRGMRERVDLLDGWLEISSGPNGGTEVAADLPIGST
jgi:hypothetical protein